MELETYGIEDRVAGYQIISGASICLYSFRRERLKSVVMTQVIWECQVSLLVPAKPCLKALKRCFCVSVHEGSFLYRSGGY